MALQKISSKILLALLMVGLVPLILAVSLATLNSQQALQQQTFDQLEAVRDNKISILEDYFTSIENQIINLSTNDTVIEALDGFSVNFLSFGGSEDGMDEGDSGELEEQSLALKNYWQNEFAKRYQSQTQQIYPVDDNLAQLSDQAIRFQYAFIANNPHPIGEKNSLNELEDEGRYGYNKYHHLIHPWLNDYLQRFGFYDIFLIDNSGNVVYSVYKELDFATNLEKGPWKDSGLARAYQQAKTLENGQITFVDLSLYPPSYDAPAGFISTPVFKTNRRGKVSRLGTLIFQMPLDKITEIMGHRSGLGETGETYLLGSDGLMRSDSFSQPETHSVINAFRNPDTAKMQSNSLNLALQGQMGELEIERNHQTYLSAYAPFDAFGKQWALFAEIESDEALAAVRNLQNQMLVMTLIMIILIIVIGRFLAGNISRPILHLTKLMHEIKDNFNFARRCDIHSKDEIGQASRAFNLLLESTEQALKSVNQTMHQISAGQFHHRIHTELKGDLQTLKNNVNASAESVETTMQNLTSVMEAIQHGDFSMRLGDEVKGEFRTTVNAAMATMDSAIKEVGEVVYQLSQGNLNQRVTSNLEGDLDALKQHTNTSIERLENAFCSIVEAAVAQSNGDLTQNIQQEMHGELNQLKQAFNASAKHLNQVIAQVIVTANTVSQASHEVSAGNQDLNQRTQSQAASLEETSAAMEELTSTLLTNSKHAHSADELAKEAMQQTHTGQTIMRETEQAINQIHESSKQIETITGLIDSIAFQTNLLALNAAVEAARAGEHGRGFAVVAGEVRNLAGKSADAAREIKTLIENTVSSIEHGTEKIQATGESLTQINTAIINVAERVSEISSASQEQQQGVTQINQSITEVDQVTQQNAALVEQTTAASESMNQQSEQLKQAVASFKVTQRNQ